MTMWPDDRDRMDAAIDDVARGMTEGAPGADLRARVLARIREPRAAWRSPWALSPLALASVMLVAVAVYRGCPADQDRLRPAGAGTELGRRAATDERPTAPRMSIDAVRPNGPARPARDGAVRRLSRSALQRAVPERSEGGKPDATRTFATSQESTTRSDVDALAPPALDVDSIALERLARPGSIVVQRLETTPITLVSIGEGDRP